MTLNGKEDTLTVKWAVWIGILVILFGSLFAGWQSNNSRITRLETNLEYTVRGIDELKTSQGKIAAVLDEIRFDQRRRQAKEKD
jgi:hypothetical protein